VALLYEGRQIYFGPAGSAKEFFLELGFVCAERATIADFLTSLTNPPERIIRAGYELRVPRTSEDFEKVWRTSFDRARLLQEIEDSRLDQQARKAEMLMPRYAYCHLLSSRSEHSRMYGA
jgi:ATP-binding cassette, subfamily G (WHITE), member 2, PDR